MYLLELLNDPFLQLSMLCGIVSWSKRFQNNSAKGFWLKQNFSFNH